MSRYLRGKFAKESKAFVEVMIRDQDDRNKLRYPDPEFEDKKMINQVKHRIVFKAYINLMISMIPSRPFWTNLIN